MRDLAWLIRAPPVLSDQARRKGLWQMRVLKKLVSLGYASSGFLCVQISAVDKAGMELLGLPESADKATAAAWP